MELNFRSVGQQTGIDLKIQPVIIEADGSSTNVGSPVAGRQGGAAKATDDALLISDLSMLVPIPPKATALNITWNTISENKSNEVHILIPLSGKDDVYTVGVVANNGVK